MRRIACFILSIIINLGGLQFSRGESILPTDSNIAWLMGLYSFDLPDSVIKAMQASFRPQTFDCGSVQVTLQEVLYDGVWLYTSAFVTPTDPETTLIMPGSANMGDFVAGGYQENLRSDQRSFQVAAMQDKKDLIIVYILPVEFEQAAYFFLDHRQDAGNQSTVFSGAPVGWMDEALTIHLSIRLELVDPSTGTYMPIDTYEFPADVQRVGPINSREYYTDQEALPFDFLSLIQTPLSVYAFPTWKSEVAESSYRFTLLDNDFIRVTRGAPPDSNTYILLELPDELNVLINMHDERTQEIMVPFSATDVEGIDSPHID